MKASKDPRCAHEYHRAHCCSREPPTERASHVAQRRAIRAKVNISSLLGIVESPFCTSSACGVSGDNGFVSAALCSGQFDSRSRRLGSMFFPLMSDMIDLGFDIALVDRGAGDVAAYVPLAVGMAAKRTYHGSNRMHHVTRHQAVNLPRIWSFE